MYMYDVMFFCWLYRAESLNPTGPAAELVLARVQMTRINPRQWTPREEPPASEPATMLQTRCLPVWPTTECTKLTASRAWHILSEHNPVASVTFPLDLHENASPTSYNLDFVARFQSRLNLTVTYCTYSELRKTIGNIAVVQSTRR